MGHDFAGAVLYGWGMGSPLTGCCVIVRCLLLRVCVVAVGLALPVALCAAEPEGLRRVGAEYHASDAWVVMEGFAVQASANKIVQWAVPEPGLKEQELWKGQMCYSVKELMAYFHSLPAARTTRGMFITGELTHLEDPEGAKALMTEYQRTKLVTDAEWMAEHRRSIAELVAACEREKIEVWINVTLDKKELRFRKLTR